MLKLTYLIIGNHGCNGGFVEKAIPCLKKLGGIDSEASYPYEAKVTLFI